MAKPIDIRGHHLLCIPRFYRGGYDKAFAENMKVICQKIRKNPETKIRVIIGLDNICHKCPYEQEGKCIQFEKIGKWVISQDKKAIRHFRLKEDSVHRAKDLFNLSMEKVNPKNIRKVCKDCIYLDNCLKVGVNNAFRKELNKKKV